MPPDRDDPSLPHTSVQWDGHRRGRCCFFDPSVYYHVHIHDCTYRLHHPVPFLKKRKELSTIFWQTNVFILDNGTVHIGTTEIFRVQCFNHASIFSEKKIEHFHLDRSHLICQRSDRRQGIAKTKPETRSKTLRDIIEHKHTHTRS